MVLGMYLPRGCTWSWGGVPSQGVYLARGYLPGGVSGPRVVPAQVPLTLWTEFLTHTFENITLPQTSFAGGKYRAKFRYAWTLLQY